MPIRRTVAAALACLALAGCTDGVRPRSDPSTSTSTSPSTVDSASAARTRRIPPAHSLVVSLNSERDSRTYGPITVTDSAQVAATVDRIDGYRVDPDGPRPCPLPLLRLDLSFRAADGGEVASATTTGCGDVYVSGGGSTTALFGADDLIRFVRDTLHVAWPTP